MATDRTVPVGERSRLGGVSVLVAAVGLAAFADQRWMAVAGALAVPVAWYLASPVYAFAVGQLALAAVLPEGALTATADLVRAGAVEVGLVGVLLASVARGGPRTTSRASVGTLVLGWTLLGGVLAWASVRSLLGVGPAVGLLAASTALTAYGLHRYQLVTLELAGGIDE